MPKSIAYIRWNYPTELDYYNSSSNTLGADLRVPIINTLLRMGYGVNIHSKMTPRDETLIQTGIGEVFDYSRFKAVGYHPGEPVTDDMVIVEAATPFTPASIKGVPYMKYVADALRGYRGTVIWYQHGGFDGRPSVMWESGAYDPNLSPNNIKNLFHDMGIRKEQVVIWTHVADRRIFVQKWPIFKGMVIMATPIGFDPEIEPQMPYNASAKYDFIYIGVNKGNRQRKLMEFLYGLPFSVLVVGNKWTPGTVDNITFVGEVKGHGKIYDLYKQARFALIIGDDQFEETGNQTTRFTQSINSGCITFGDARFKGVERVVGRDMLVSSRMELLDKVANLRNPEVVLRAQQRNLPTWETVLSRLLPELERVI